MKYVIDDDILSKYNISRGEFLYLLLNKEKLSIPEIRQSIIDKKLCGADLFSEEDIVLSEKNISLINEILVESSKEVQNTTIDYMDIAKAMQECYPKGKKPGTTYQWRDSTNIIAKKLKALTANFDFHFTKEQAVQATESYIKSFNGDYKLMHLLKYFILKNDRGAGEVRSEFMSYIENAGQEDSNNNEWTSTLR